MTVNRQQPLPYRIEPVRFPYPALASLAARQPLGGGREIALAVLTCARLASGVAGAGALAAQERSVRAGAARVWLASMALPAPIRATLTKCVDATAGAPSGIATALRALLGATANALDEPSVAEIEHLIRRLSSAM